MLIISRSHGRHLMVFGLLLLAALPLTQAVPLQKTDVPADPMWLLHLDLDRLRPTSVGRYIITEMEKPDAQAKLAAFQSLFKFDLRTQLHGLTVYGMPDAPDKGVLLVYADFDADHLTTLAKGANDYQGTHHNQHTIHSWIDDSKKKRNGVKPRVYASAQASRVLIFGQSEAAIAKALDVLDSTAPNLRASKTFPALDSASAFFQVAAQNMKVKDSDPNSAVLRLSKSVRFQVGEDQNTVNGALQLTAGDEDVARQIASIGQGLVSLMKLQRDRPEAGKLADALSFTQDSTDVTVRLTLAAADAVELMKADAARKAKKTE